MLCSISMTKKFKRWFFNILLVGLLIVSYLYWKLDAFTLHIYNFETKNGNFKYVVIPQKGRDLEMMKHAFILYRHDNPSTVDTVLYRTFKPNYLKFWNWHGYATNELYSYEFKK